jgi:protein-S-isoprenylcysteine O-methyltransferase Ste14
MSDQLALKKAEVNKGVVRWAIRETVGLVMYLPFLFGSAGTWDWPMAWALILLTGLWILATALVTIPRYPELLAERIRPGPGSKRWDLMILSMIGMLSLVKMLLAGFDIRFSWTGGLPLEVQIVGMAIAIAGYGLAVWATASNAFFSAVTRIQTDRGHTVATGGPYRYVRHPAYVGMILIEVGTALMLGSWLALIPAAVSVVLVLLRTVLEDRTLVTELAGYQEFAEKTRYRLIPGVW